MRFFPSTFLWPLLTPKSCLEVVKVLKDKSRELSLTQRIVLDYEKAPIIDEVRRVTEAIANIGVKLAFILLAETGFRPQGYRPLHLFKTKGAYISFISKPLHSFIVGKYLPWREWFLEQYKYAVDNIGRDIEEWRSKFIPLSKDRIRAEIKASYGENWD